MLLIAEDRDTEGDRAAVKAIEADRRDGLTIERRAPPAPHKDWSAVNEATAPPRA